MSSHILFRNAVVLSLLNSSPRILLGKGSVGEVHEHAYQRLPACLFDTQMGVDGCVSGGAVQVLDLLVTLPNSHQEVVEFGIVVDEVTGTGVFDL